MKSSNLPKMLCLPLLLTGRELELALVSVGPASSHAFMFWAIYGQSINAFVHKKTFLCFYVTAHCHKKLSLERIFKPPVPPGEGRSDKVANYPRKRCYPPKRSPHGSYRLGGANTQAWRSPRAHHGRCSRCSAPANPIIRVPGRLPAAVLFLQRLVALSPGPLTRWPP